MTIRITTLLTKYVVPNYVWSCKSVHELAMAFQCINIKMHTHQFTKYPYQWLIFERDKREIISM